MSERYTAFHDADSNECLVTQGTEVVSPEEVLALLNSSASVREERDRLREALAFYADRKNYLDRGGSPEVFDDEDDEGEIARQALSPPHAAEGG